MEVCLTHIMALVMKGGRKKKGKKKSVAVRAIGRKTEGGSEGGKKKGGGGGEEWLRCSPVFNSDQGVRTKGGGKEKGRRKKKKRAITYDLISSREMGERGKKKGKEGNFLSASGCPDD